MATNYVSGDDTSHTPNSQQPARVYQEAACCLRYKETITTITATKLQRVMELLQLEPNHLVERGLAPRSSLAEGLGWSEKQRGCPQQKFSSSVEFDSSGVKKCFKGSSQGTDEETDDTQDDDQDLGWGDYEDNCDSDSDIDDDEDQDDKIEGRRKGPIYAFLVYGGVQLRPDEYVLLFRALGISPQYIEQLFLA